MATILEIMETEPYTCGREATIGEVIRQLTDVQVSGIPIVDAARKPVGFVSDVDLIRFIAHNNPRVYDWGDTLLPVVMDEDSLEDKLRALLAVPVIDIAQSKIVCVETDWEIDEVADLFKQEKVRKMAVLEGEQVVGVVTRSAVLRYLLSRILPEES